MHVQPCIFMNLLLPQGNVFHSELITQLNNGCALQSLRLLICQYEKQQQLPLFSAMSHVNHTTRQHQSQQ